LEDLKGTLFGLKSGRPKQPQGNRQKKIGGENLLENLVLEKLHSEGDAMESGLPEGASTLSEATGRLYGWS